jgi:hypothetical protein
LKSSNMEHEISTFPNMRETCAEIIKGTTRIRMKERIKKAELLRSQAQLLIVFAGC